MSVLRDGWRNLIAQPVPATGAALILALGIAASTAVSSAAGRLLLRPIPAPDLDDLVVGWELDPSRTDSLVEVSLPYFRELSAGNRSLESLAAFGSVNWSHVFTGPGRPEQVAAAAVSASFFETLRARPALGRGFLPHEDEPGAADVLVLSHGLWQRRYAGDPSVVGSTLATGETVVGVMPADFDFPRGAELWRALAPALEPVRESMTPARFRGLGVLYVLGRLRPGVSLGEARSDLGEIARRLSIADGFSTDGWRVELVPIVDHHLGAGARKALEALVAAAGVLLLLACANAALLLLSHTAARRGELAIRRALGASTARVIGEQVAKGLGVVTLAGGAGALLAAAALRGVVAHGPHELPELRDLGIDAPALGIAVLLTLAVALLVTLAPTWYAVRLPVGPTLKAAAGGASTDARGRRLDAVLVVTEVTLATVLLVGSGLAVRSFDNLRHVELGFAPELTLSFGVERWDAEGRPLEEAAFVGALLERVEVLPGVTAAGAVNLRPLEHGPIGSGAWLLPEGSRLDLASIRDNSVSANWQVATPGYFRAVGTRLLAGRSFTEPDTGEAPKVVVISESAARRSR